MARSIIPWFILNVESKELIVLPNVPMEITSTKDAKYTQTAVPGASADSIQFAGLGATKLSFSIILLKKDPIVGNMPTLKQFENLRVPKFSVVDGLIPPANNKPPAIWFWYGSGMTAPQEYHVSKMEFRHKMYNRMGFPQHTDINVELIMNEHTKFYTFEKYSRAVLSTLGTIESLVTLIKYWIGGRNPYTFNTFTAIKRANPGGSTGFSPGG